MVLVLRDANLKCSLSSGQPIRAGEVRVQWVGADGLAAFRWGARAPTPVDLQAWVAKQPGAAVLEVGLRVDEAHAELARMGRALRDAGGVVVRAEASGAACDLESWIRVFDAKDLAQTYRLLVAVVGDTESTSTCGMHLFDLPEAEISGLDAVSAVEWIDALCLYQLLEGPALSSGHTFRPDSGHERQYIERWPDPVHEAEDGRHNPFGIWRILDASRRAVQAREPALMLMPSLVSVLHAAETSAGRPLSAREVESVVAQSCAVAMELKDKIRLEKSRGYADLEPDLAWEQWQIVRRTNHLGCK
ncbi:MAG: hypothetical protein IPG45_16100 [Deltaproteobacteria bacterium]|nr:hypothetical protein [Deltaproteobacteria bacterium]